MTEAAILLIAVLAIMALTLTQGLQIYYLKERIERIEEFIELVCKEAREEIDSNGHEK